MKNKKKVIIIALVISSIVLILFIVGIAAFLLLTSTDINDAENSDTYTLMIYMCASDLESSGGYASDDIEEMLNSNIDKKVNVLIETGGTYDWKRYGISNESNQIYKVEDGNLKLVKDDIGLQSMTNPDTLTNYISYCKEMYPADKYGLILWDHGGGAVSGYGYDENNQDKEDTLTIDELKNSLIKSNCKFDFIGFDACLMANIETAFSIKDNARYLVASEETEGAGGWDYISLLNYISSNTSQPTADIGKNIVDSFVENSNAVEEDATLSVIDLSKIENVFYNLNKFMTKIKQEDLESSKFAYISKAVKSSKAYGDGQNDLIDLVDFAGKVGNDESQNLINSINDAVIYNKISDNVKNSNGLSIYFPYNDLSYYEKMLQIYPNIGIDKNYTDTLTTFVNILVGGKTGEYEINSHTYSLNENYSQYGWYNESVINENQSYYQDNKYDQLNIEPKDGYYILNISDNDWKNIASINCEVFYDDSKGFIDLGSDNYYELDEDNNLKITFDKTWISVNGNTVPFYATESTDEYTKGKIPACLNDEFVNLIVLWKNNEEEGKILGAEPIDDYANTTIESKGLKKLKKGDSLEFVFDYYTYDGKYSDSYTIGDKLVLNDENLKVNYEDVGEGKYYVYYKITDIYGNFYYTDSVIF